MMIFLSILLSLLLGFLSCHLIFVRARTINIPLLFNLSFPIGLGLSSALFIFLNLLGNKFFSIAFTWLLEQKFKDTLCGTKVIFRKDYYRLVKNQSYFGNFDPFGDYDLIFGAHKLNHKIVEIPIRYKERTYGSTNISRFKHGIVLLRMCFFAARKIKFI